MKPARTEQPRIHASVPLPKPLVRWLAAAPEERLYGFSRKLIFSPEICGNRSIRCCAVSGPHGARSSEHSHPGDEVVIALDGENRTSVDGQSFTLRRLQALAIPPGTGHSTTVTAFDGWRGISFYCDCCPYIQTSQAQPHERQPTVKPLKTSVSKHQAGLHQADLFSPAQRETAYLHVSLFIGAGKAGSDILRQGETIYVPLQGMFTLSWTRGETSLQPGMAAAIPANFPHRLEHHGTARSLLAVCSCSSCGLAGNAPSSD